MTAIRRLSCLVGISAMLGSATSCVWSTSSFRYGEVLDADRLAQVKVGRTGLREILEWFGPPDYIIDGTQNIPEHTPQLSIQTSQGTRTLSSRSNEVLLIYTAGERVQSTVVGATLWGTYDEERQVLRPHEVMIIVRKDDYKVTGVITPKDAP